MPRLNIAGFLLVIVLCFAVVVILPKDPGAEAAENRSMTPWPELTSHGLTSGQFFKDIENYLLDNTAFRTRFLDFASNIELFYGLPTTGGATMVDFSSDDLGYGLTPILNTAQAEVFDQLRIGPVGERTLGQDINFNENAVLYLRYIEDPALATRYAQVLNAHRYMARDDIRMFSMLAPVKVEFMDARYQAVNSSQRGTIDLVNSLLTTGIIPVDVHTPLYNHQDEYIFFRLDHHWTALGAYYAYQAFATAAGFSYNPLDNFIAYKIDGFVGSLAVGTRNQNILNSPDIIWFYKIDNGTLFSQSLHTIPEDLSDACYRIFLGGDHALLYFSTSNTNGRTLVIVKDSFANAFVPFAAAHYQNIVMIDPRQYVGSISPILDQFDDIDLLFLNYMPATTMAELIEQIYNVR